MGLTPVYVCIHVSEFPAQALLRLRPELKGRAVVVMAGDPPLEEVCSANPHALRLGIAHGMTKTELESFRGVCVLRQSATEERSARNVVMEVASGFTPRIEVPPARGSALDVVLDMTGTDRIFGQVQEVVAKISRAFVKLRFSMRITASANFHTALCLAPMAAKPIVVPPGQENEYLRNLPLAALPLTEQQVETLELWGLRSLGELACLPEKELVIRLGHEGEKLRLLARGECRHLMVPEEAPLTLAEYIAFDSPVELLDSLLFVLGPMLDQLLARARNRALALASITISLGIDGGGEHIRLLKPALPVSQRDVLLKLIYLDLQGNPPPAGVMSVSLKAEPGDRSKVQLGLFAPQTPEPMHLDVTLARVAALVGEERVGRARLLDSHAPEAFVMERFTVPDSATVKTNEEKRSITALRRCRPPVRLTVRFDESRPAAFSFAGKRYIVQKAFGPWRRSGDWWSPSVWSFEDWDVCAADVGGDTLVCILAHDLLRHHWQIEALYD
ncbi:MAG TPA: DNA polymerase Y family protein [Acidobacteriaceae bacterium]|nr:DNA polymerase Y family protein [Acidobacteriaceae bacterium]